ncbi:hypothetical protein EGW08_015041 [Elysia chlorotica]|uniref:Uncharacterized protein n=1 Tax=Elysia chlorotica TaxID=188477 RepID=A0A3S0ZKV5_ELYCH|nr:hypothetical protein EGW08_015041 [Elysia chlorotica]
MSKYKTRRLPWECHCVIPKRRAAMRMKKEDASINVWQTEYQRSYTDKRTKSQRTSSTPTWVPVYHAQQKQKVERGTPGWAVGAGDGPAHVTPTKHKGQDKAQRRNVCYHHQHSHHDCHAKDQQHSYSNEKQESGVNKTSCNCQTSVRTASMAQDDVGYMWNTPSNVMDSKLRARARAAKDQARSDSGLKNPSVALCLWRANDKSSPTPFSCLPWQQQVAQMALEAKA